MKVSRKYKEIFKLKKMLEDAEIPFDFYSMQDLEPGVKDIMPSFEHWHINYPSKAKCIISAIEGVGTYGETDDKIEIMGGLTKEEEESGDNVIGWLTAEEVFERIKKDYGGIKMKKTVKVVNEETLELEELTVEEENELSDEQKDEYRDAIRKAMNCSVEEFVQKYNDYKTAKLEFDAVYEPFKKGLIQLHKDMPGLPKTIIGGNVKMTYVSPSTRSTIDTKKLKEEEPEIAKKFTKTTNVEATVRLDSIF